MTRWLRNLLLALATGFILFVFSERIFWSVWRPGDSFADLGITWLAYSVVAYLFLVVVAWSRADDGWSVFLAGAVYGWLVEGGLADTLYGTQPSAPFPISISITGLSWHALISVMLGWWATGKALSNGDALRLVWISLAVGIFWGVWAMFPRQETPPILTPVPEFFANALVLTLGLIAAWSVNFRAGVCEFRPGWIGMVLATLAVAVFLSGHVSRMGAFRVVVLPGLLILAIMPLYLHRRRTSFSTSIPFRESSSSWQLAMLGLIPITATVVYCGAVALGLDRFPIPLIVYAVSGLVGFLWFVVAIVVTIRSPHAKSIEAPSGDD